MSFCPKSRQLNDLKVEFLFMNFITLNAEVGYPFNWFMPPVTIYWPFQCGTSFEPRHKKTNVLCVRKQRRRSFSR